MNLREAAIAQLDALLDRYERATTQSFSPDRIRLKELLTSAEATIGRLAPPGSPYTKGCEQALSDGGADSYVLEHLLGIVAALRHDYAAGLLAPVHELIRSEVFDDFLDMADHLLDTGYKDPAAALTGGVLEQHLRRVAARRNFPVEENGKPKKADTLNADLAKEGAYNKTDQKAVTAWLGLRNHAAHGQYDDYGPEQIRVMLLGVRDFVNRTT